MTLFGVNLLELASLVFFSLASAGFLLFMLRYSRLPKIRRWGIRVCHLLGFLGVLCHRLYHGQFTELALLIISSLVVSLLAFELTSKFLRIG